MAVPVPVSRPRSTTATDFKYDEFRVGLVDLIEYREAGIRRRRNGERGAWRCVRTGSIGQFVRERTPPNLGLHLQPVQLPARCGHLGTLLEAPCSCATSRLARRSLEVALWGNNLPTRSTRRSREFRALEVRRPPWADPLPMASTGIPVRRKARVRRPVNGAADLVFCAATLIGAARGKAARAAAGGSADCRSGYTTTRRAGARPYGATLRR